MKTTNVSPIVQLDAEEMKKYSAVNENLSVDLSIPQPSVKGHVFSTVDLWRLRRQRRVQGRQIR